MLHRQFLLHHAGGARSLRPVGRSAEWRYRGYATAGGSDSRVGHRCSTDRRYLARARDRRGKPVFRLPLRRLLVPAERGAADRRQPRRLVVALRRHHENIVARSGAHDSGLCAADKATHRCVDAEPRSRWRRRFLSAARSACPRSLPVVLAQTVPRRGAGYSRSPLPAPVDRWAFFACDPRGNSDAPRQPSVCPHRPSDRCSSALCT